MAVLAFCAGLIPLALPAWAGSAGNAVVAEPNSTAPLADGGSLTPFSLILPKGARCPGDTASKSFHVDSYVLPERVKPPDVHFRGGWPYGYEPLEAFVGAPFFAINTERNTGRVLGLPVFSWNRYARLSLVDPGVYNIGIMCSDRNDNPTTYWNTRVRFQTDATDPHHLRWVAIGSTATTTASGGTSGPAVVAIVLVVAVALVGVVLVARRRAAARRARSIANA